MYELSCLPIEHLLMSVYHRSMYMNMSVVRRKGIQIDASSNKVKKGDGLLQKVKVQSTMVCRHLVKGLAI